MLNQPSGTRGYEIESENDEYADIINTIKFKKLRGNSNTWEGEGYKISLERMQHDGYGFTSLYVLSHEGRDLGDYYRLKNAKKSATEDKEFY